MVEMIKGVLSYAASVYIFGVIFFGGLNLWAMIESKREIEEACGESIHPLSWLGAFLLATLSWPMMLGRFVAEEAERREK
jgi:hypothetical protein